MPIHTFTDDRHLVEKGLRNYWGYNTIGFFAPEMRYCAQGHMNEFKTMVRKLHSAGIEVILDVVYNHTAEGNHFGPTLSFRGIDNAAYYRLVPDNPRYYTDYTGTGNTLNMMHPRVLQLIMDSLRYWVLEMHVDGFRFDLAAALARELHDVDRLGAFFDIIHQDPVLSRSQADRGTLGSRAKAAIRSAISRLAGRSGTGATATVSAAIGRAMMAPSAISPTGSRDRATCTKAAADCRLRASTSSPRTTASRCSIS